MFLLIITASPSFKRNETAKKKREEKKERVRQNGNRRHSKQGRIVLKAGNGKCIYGKMNQIESM